MSFGNVVLVYVNFLDEIKKVFDYVKLKGVSIVILVGNDSSFGGKICLFLVDYFDYGVVGIFVVVDLILIVVFYSLDK